MHHPASTSRQLLSGFTLIEAMVAIAIAAILAALAGPSLVSTLQRYRVETAAEELFAAISQTKSVALQRNGFTRLQRLSGGECPTLAENHDWSCGWFIYVDSNANGAKDSTETQIQEFRISDQLKVTAPAGISGMTANRWGQINGLGAIGITVQPSTSANASDARRVCVNAAGRVRIAVGDSC